MTDDPVGAMNAATRALSLYGAHPPPGMGEMLGLNARSNGSRLPSASARYHEPWVNADDPPASADDPAPAAPETRSGRRVRRARRSTRTDASATNAAATTTDDTTEGTATSAAAQTGNTASTVRPARAARRTTTADGAPFVNTAADAAAHPSAIQANDPPAVRRAKARIQRELMDLIATDFPTPEARRAAIAQTHQRLLRGETVRAARGEQPLRATATAATQAALVEHREDALNAVREERVRAAEAARARRAAAAARMRAQGEGTEANVRAREQGFNFDIGGMPGYLGELEAMQVTAMGKGKKDAEEKKK